MHGMVFSLDKDPGSNSYSLRLLPLFSSKYQDLRLS